MQIMTILGSPRRQGNTAQVLGWIETLVVGGCTDPEAIGDDVERRAIEFAGAITGKIAG
jgi:outer membrane lipoprotein SlyB